MLPAWPPSLLFRQKYKRRDPFDLLRELTVGEAPFLSLIHVGAHLAQERSKYELLGYNDILWVEGSPAVFHRLAETLPLGVVSGHRNRAVCALLTDREGDDAELRQVSNDGMSSSIFPLGDLGVRSWGVHESGLRDKVRTRTLDSVAAEFRMTEVDTLVVDVQGAELLVLEGGRTTLGKVRAVVAEVSRKPYYEGGVLFPQLRRFLKQRGFVPMAPPRRHGDLLFLRRG